MSSTSGSCSSSREPQVAQAAGSPRDDGHVAVRAREGGDPVAPPELARDAPVADVRASTRSRSSSTTPARSGPCPSSTARDRGLGERLRSSRTTASERYGSIDVVAALAGAEVDRRAARPPTRRPSCSSRATIRLRASKRSRPANSPASAVIFPSGPMTTTAGSPWRWPDREVVGVVRGRHLHDPRAELAVHEDRVLDDRELAARRSGGSRVLPRRPARARVLRVDRERRVAEHRLGPRRRDDRALRHSRHVVADLVERPLRRLRRRPRGPRRRCRSPGTS